MSSNSSPIELTILSVKPQDSHVQEMLGIVHSKYLHVHHAASHVYVKKKLKKKTN